MSFYLHGVKADSGESRSSDCTSVGNKDVEILQENQQTTQMIY